MLDGKAKRSVLYAQNKTLVAKHKAPRQKYSHVTHAVYDVLAVHVAMSLLPCVLLSLGWRIQQSKTLSPMAVIRAAGTL